MLLRIMQRSRKWTWIVSVVIVAFLVRQLVMETMRAPWQQYRVEPSMLMLSGIFFLLSMPLFGLAWNAVVRSLQPERRISNFLAARMYITAQFGRYLPGSIWTYLMHMYLGSRQGLSAETAALASLYEIILSTIAVFLLPILLLGLAVYKTTPVSVWAMGAVLVFGLVILHPKVLSWCWKLLPRVWRNFDVGKAKVLPYRRVLGLLVGYMGIMALNGVGFTLFVEGFHPGAISDTMMLAGFFVLASGLGTLAIFAPGGLGVREGFLAFFLNTMLPQPLSIFIALASRVWITLLEVVAYAGVWIIGRLSNRDNKSLQE